MALGFSKENSGFSYPWDDGLKLRHLQIRESLDDIRLVKAARTIASKGRKLLQLSI
jgi:hypothetical protein